MESLEHSCWNNRVRLGYAVVEIVEVGVLILSLRIGYSN
jgi:hypothetical protein